MIASLKSKLGTILRAAKGCLRSRIESLPTIPSGLSTKTIGTTVQGRDIVSYRMGNGPTKLVFCGAIHGNEVGTGKLVQFLLSYLHEQKDLHSRFTFHCVPVLNVDGYASGRAHPDYLHGGRVGRFNTNGVDLNRNFPTTNFTQKSVWSHGKGYTETTEVFCGNAPGSEPENLALRAFVKKENASLLWMFHSVASEIMASRDDQAEHLAALFAAKTGFVHASHDEWKNLQQTGTAKEWCEENRIMYLESEASERWGSDWMRQKPGIEAVLEQLAAGDVL